jgi:hypothetical protein
MLNPAQFDAVAVPMSDNGIYQVLCSLPFLVATVTRKPKPELRRCSRRPHHPLVGQNPLKFEPVSPTDVSVIQEIRRFLDTEQLAPVVECPPLALERQRALLPRLRSLQAVIARLPKTVVVADLYKTTYYIAKLACGHEFIEYPQAHSITAKRRNCVTCAKLKFATEPSPQFPVAKEAEPGSVPLPPKSVRLNSKNEGIA